jgi:hypothetical protein
MPLYMLFYFTFLPTVSNVEWLSYSLTFSQHLWAVRLALVATTSDTRDGEGWNFIVPTSSTATFHRVYAAQIAEFVVRTN